MMNLAKMTTQFHPHRLLLDAENGVPLPPIRTNSTYNSDANSDINMVILLAALLCALLCAFGLYSIVRGALRCCHGFVLETPVQEAIGHKKGGLTKIPVVVYGSGLNLPATDCPICLGEFWEGEKVRILPQCNHGFHVKCIDTWLVSNSTCPLCRQPIMDHRTNSSM
jgi:E3 ubiquitin-protein ligase ATL10/75/76/77/78